MAYSPQWNHLRQTVLAIADEVKQQFPRDWDALTRKDTAYIRRVAFACQQAGLKDVGLNGKRGNVDDLSSDVLAFPNPSGCPDKAGKFAGLELHDIIAAVEDPNARHLTWGDATPETIEAGVGGAWVAPAAVGGAPKPTPTPKPTPPPPPKKSYEDAGGDAFFERELGKVLAKDYAERPQPMDAGSVVWASRVIWDHLNEGLPIADSIAKHRHGPKGWRQALGLPQIG